MLQLHQQQLASLQDGQYDTHTPSMHTYTSGETQTFTFSRVRDNFMKLEVPLCQSQRSSSFNDLHGYNEA